MPMKPHIRAGHVSAAWRREHTCTPVIVDSHICIFSPNFTKAAAKEFSWVHSKHSRSACGRFGRSVNFFLIASQFLSVTSCSSMASSSSVRLANMFPMSFRTSPVSSGELEFDFESCPTEVSIVAMGFWRRGG